MFVYIFVLCQKIPTASTSSVEKNSISVIIVEASSSGRRRRQPLQSRTPKAGSDLSLPPGLRSRLAVIIQQVFRSPRLGFSFDLQTFGLHLQSLLIRAFANFGHRWTYNSHPAILTGSGSGNQPVVSPLALSSLLSEHWTANRSPRPEPSMDRHENWTAPSECHDGGLCEIWDTSAVPFSSCGHNKICFFNEIPVLY